MNFSVLLSVYEKENPLFFEEALNSIINQTLQPTEIVVVKDGPISLLLDKVIKKYIDMYPSMFKVISLEKNVGLGEALKVGVNNCSNEIIARMDTDDISLPNRFEKQIPLIVNNKSISILGSWIAEFNENPSEVHSIRKVPLTYEEIKNSAKYRNPLNHMSVVFRKSVILEVGNYKSFIGNEDYYLWVRTLLKGFKIVNTEDVLLKVRTGDSMYSRRGGINYFITEIKLQKVFLKLGFTNIFDLFRNLLIRGSVRLLPNKIRAVIYRKVLRA